MIKSKPSLRSSSVFEQLVQLEQEVQVLMQDLDLEGREDAAVKRPRLLPIPPFLAHDASDEKLPALLRADWDLLEFPLFFWHHLCRQQQQYSTWPGRQKPGRASHGR